LQTLIENAGWLVADKISRLGVGLVIGVWVARYLGPERFGSLNYANALIMLVSALGTMGLPEVAVRDFVRHPERAREIAATSVLLRIGGALCAIIVAVTTIYILRPAEDEMLRLVVVIGCSLVPQALDVVDQFCQSQNNVRSVVIVRNAAFLVFVIAKIVAILMGASVVVFGALITGEYLVVSVTLYLCARQFGLSFRLADATAGEALRLMRESWPLLLRGLFINVYMRVDQVMIGNFLDDRAVGLYSAATRVSEIWYFIPVAIMTAAVPHLTGEHLASRRSYEANLLKVTRVVVAISVLAAVGLSAGANFIVQFFYGPAYGDAIGVLAIHAWAGLFVGLGVASSSWFIVNNLTQYGLYQAFVGAAVSVLLNSLLIGAYGVVGAAWAAIGSYAVSAVLMNGIFSVTRPVFWLQLRAIGLR
jgi:PST family polysaccharide transporter